MYPLFFSVSQKDIEFAEQIWDHFPADWAYLYSKSGELGAHMWDEIALKELPKAKIIVVFWSKNFATSGGCVKEAIQAAKLYRNGTLKPLIIRLDDYPLFWREGMSDDLRPAFDAVRVLADYRATEASCTADMASRLIARMAEPFLHNDHPRMPRHDLVRALRHAMQLDKFTLAPSCWISGFNGVGRESIIREVNRDLAPNAIGAVIEVNETTLPRQLLLRIESEVFGRDLDYLSGIIESVDENDVDSVVSAIERVFESGNYLILRHGRVVQEEVELPEWLDDIAKKLKPASRPKLYIVSQMPLAGQRLLKNRDVLVAFRVPTVDEQQLTEFCNQLIGYFDFDPHRWPDNEIARLVKVAAGNIGFLVALTRSASRMRDFEQIEAMLAQEDDRIAEAITVYVRWAFLQLKDYPDERKLLLFLNNVSPCHVLDLDIAIRPKLSILRVVSRLVDLGLVERETDEIYRLTPLLANRLNRELIQPELVKWIDEAQRVFCSQPFEVESKTQEGGHELVRLEARIQAALLSGGDGLPGAAKLFVSAAHWFQAGIRLYHASKWKHAYRLLRKAYESRGQFRDASRLEIDRYFCLAATRMRKYPESEECIARLNRDVRSKPIAAFLQADLYEYRRQFLEAIEAYNLALDLNSDKDRRREFIYRPLIRCILSTRSPDFRRAEVVAKSYVNLKRTVFSLNSLARVYLHWKHRGVQAGRDVPVDIDLLIKQAFRDLESHPGANAAPFELYAEEAEFTGDFTAALENMDQAIHMDPDRFQLRVVRWRLMAGSGRREFAEQALRELDAAKLNARFEAIWSSYVHSLAETYVRALLASGQRAALVNGFAPELQQNGELGRIISQSKH